MRAALLFTVLMSIVRLSCGSSAHAQIIPNDGQDDTAAIQAILDRESRSATAQGNATLPPGVLDISDTLIVSRSMGFYLSGSGGQNRSENRGWDRFRTGTIIRWNGPPDKPMLILSGCSGSVFDRINFVASEDKPAAQGILIRHGVGSLDFSFRQCGWMGLDVGVQCAVNVREATCANITFDTPLFYRCKTAFRTANEQSPEHLFIRPEFAFCGINLDLAESGHVTVIGGGSYQAGTMVRIGTWGSNNRGLNIIGHRFDGLGVGHPRTRWLDFVDETKRRSYGTMVFQGTTQITNQAVGPAPLVEVAPGSRVVLRECGFVQKGNMVDGKLAHVYSTDKAPGELHVLRCDGLNAERLADYVTLHGPLAHYRFVDTGSLFQESRSLTNMESAAGQPGPQQFTDDEAAAIREALELVRRIREGELEAKLPD